MDFMTEGTQQACLKCDDVFDMQFENRGSNQSQVCEHLKEALRLSQDNLMLLCFSCRLQQLGVRPMHHVCVGCYKFQCKECFHIMKTCPCQKSDSQYSCTLCQFCTLCSQCKDFCEEDNYLSEDFYEFTELFLNMVRNETGSTTQLSVPTDSNS